MNFVRCKLGSITRNYGHRDICSDIVCGGHRAVDHGAFGIRGDFLRTEHGTVDRGKGGGSACVAD